MNKSLFAAVIALVIPASTVASPSGKFEPAICQFNTTARIPCDIKYEYGNRASHFLMTIRWSDGPETRLSRETGVPSGTPWTDSLGGKWLQTDRLNYGRGVYAFVNVRNNNVISIRNLEWSGGPRGD